MAQITYANKSDINTTATPATNKVTSADMNEIKSVVNTNANLMGDLETLTTSDKSSVVNAINSTRLQITTDGSAIKTGRVIDGYEEYVKRITLDGFPDINQTKSWDTGITMTNAVITDLVVMVKSGIGNWFPIPNNDIVNSRVGLNNDGKIYIEMFVGSLYGNNGYAEITYYYQS